MTVVIYRADKETPPSSASFTRLDRVRLNVGRNHLDDKQMAIVQKHPDFDRYVELGAIEIIKGKEPPPEEPDSLAGYSIAEAEKLIKETNDLEQLKRWQSNESRAKNRKTVLNAIAVQIGDVEGGKL